MPAAGMMEVCAVAEPGKLGGPTLRPIGRARLQADGTIRAWLDALPVSGELILRWSPTPAPLMLAQDEDGLLAVPVAGQA